MYACNYSSNPASIYVKAPNWWLGTPVSLYKIYFYFGATGDFYHQFFVVTVEGSSDMDHGICFTYSVFVVLYPYVRSRYRSLVYESGKDSGWGTYINQTT